MYFCHPRDNIRERNPPRRNLFLDLCVGMLVLLLRYIKHSVILASNCDAFILSKTNGMHGTRYKTKQGTKSNALNSMAPELNFRYSDFKQILWLVAKASAVKLPWNERHSTLLTLVKVMLDAVRHQTIIWANADRGSCIPVYCLDV